VNEISRVGKEGERASNDTALVWDLPVRLIHWSLLVAVIGSWLTRELEGDWFSWHTRFGYVVLILVTTRILWGFLGTHHARFSSFVRDPKTVIEYLQGKTRGTVGHNPLGALMILAMLAMLLIQSVTGLFANDQVFETGPLFGHVSIEMSDRLTSLHKQLFDWIVVAVSVHVAAALFYLFVRRDNLLKPMITGYKPAELVPHAERIESSKLWLATLLLATVGGLLAWIVLSAPEASIYIF